MRNFATSVVEAAPSPATSGTTLTVRSGHGARFVAGLATIYPASGIIDPTTAEVCAITPAGDDVLTLVRAREGTTARTVIAGDLVIQGLTAGMWVALAAAVPAAVAATQTASFTTAAGCTYPCDSSGGAVTVTVHAGTAGDVIRVVNIGASGAVILSQGGSTISLTRQWDLITLQCLAPGAWIEV